MEKTKFRKLVTRALNLQCKPVTRKPAAYLIKIAGPMMGLVPTLRDVYPDAVFLFMYREGLEMAQSSSRMHCEDLLLSLMAQVMWLLPKRLKPWSTVLRIYDADLPENLETMCSNLLSYNVTLWAMLCRIYRRQRQQGLQMSAIKYAHLVANPRRNVQKIFEHCGLDALDQDSQTNCIFSRQSLGKHSTPQLTPDTKVITDDVCDYFGMPRIPQPCLLEGTITSL